MDTIKVKLAEVRSIVRATFPAYHGRRFTVDASGRVTFSDLHWGGGSKNEYRALRLDGMQVAPVPAGSPWESPTEGLTVEIPIGILVVEHSRFQGRDIGIRVYCNPGDLRSRMLPPHRGPTPCVLCPDFKVDCRACDGTGRTQPRSFDETSHYRAEG